MCTFTCEYLRMQTLRECAENVKSLLKTRYVLHQFNLLLLLMSTSRGTHLLITKKHVYSNAQCHKYTLNLISLIVFKLLYSLAYH